MECCNPVVAMYRSTLEGDSMVSIPAILRTKLANAVADGASLAYAAVL